MPLYRNFCTQEEIDQEYNLSARARDLDEIFEWYLASSRCTRAELPCHLDIRYGPTLDETLDIFPSPRKHSPVLVFVHGGYWRSMSSKEFSFVARGFVEKGVTVVVTNYALCPKVTIAEITRQSRAAIAWLYDNIQQYSGDPAQIFVMGHSAGGHQATMLAVTDWECDYGLPGDILKSVISVSGIYDLAPLRYSFLQPIFQLDYELIRKQSPVHNIPDSAPPLLAIVAEREPEEFHRQARDFIKDWNTAGLQGSFEVHGDEDHFSVVKELYEPESPFCAQVSHIMNSWI